MVCHIARKLNATYFGIILITCSKDSGVWDIGYEHLLYACC